MIRTSLKIVFYTKPNCSLCDEAEELLREMETLFKLSIHKIDITTDFKIYNKYKHKIPVIEINNKYCLSGRISGKELKKKIQLCMKRI
ncbi:glutaredoxin family protein [SCandidatus Aminicenantes bacterium Aminicenantia_JdfR_composite]|jgi:glutaredoxin|nr:glutaredoxin family protein [SCandidatus Aminicenantes bacterium Aminicenantia_JdfR_composite]MCP2598433.1 glutaredoxin family protein [Candidatus Aminicenantes bacterium AC-335-L06]MCP2598444.1 glutaredoxin family protein [Candidatus Aminicenantes bacterium AC-335-L06]MCP2605705.1 glutaredoxin family protein [Candidatus Aminicenantes bacterium AC-335-O07]